MKLRFILSEYGGNIVNLGGEDNFSVSGFYFFYKSCFGSMSEVILVVVVFVVLNVYFLFLCLGFCFFILYNLDLFYCSVIF